MFFKNGTMIGAGTVTPSGATEITEAEYNALLSEMQTASIHAQQIAAQNAAMSGTVRPTYDNALSVLPVTLPDGTVTTLGEAAQTDSTAPFELLSKWELCYDNGLCYKQVEDPDGIGSKDNPFIGDGIPQTSWPLKAGAYYRDGDKLYQYVSETKLTGTVSKFVEVAS